MVLRIVLGALYAAMAAGQLASVREMPGILAAYGLVHGAAATALAAGLIAGELVCAAWFLGRPRSRASAPVWVFTGVALVWALLAAQAFARGLTVANCGCFGVYLTQRLSWFVLVQDALLLCYAGLLLYGTRRRPAPRAAAGAPGHHAPPTPPAPPDRRPSG
ncbi:MauE/DoxX family redox-associated membrane protein [Streptomyces sp. PR69]|uniref:MauE/DoxX family redox-associated membrane protein n=1 Tax=Streptomyces sp. PR69 TaxID=2984950 RepID=UPI002264B292|nr:MauE/DoxX family redox-associated membrane protein [Streptomyces sp. PR69]